ncbi:hypothetical protein [Sutcliffiella rhizosphaerae]|uniref:Uncharacterized protein n=1 Tax=Sutcliffiella rhizosphaerae TaxID=2880967 RepID=A0ABM8YP67_9BACI|nr:hypothetical protein [Sutcliffiella rhizosphaerae]CAG9621791.1 hypothetical protein BACCIP111883_02564 [Sutcliffiella rhizosphaerae]
MQDHLTTLYKQLWNNRSLNEDSVGTDVLQMAIQKELKDEMTHPRIRKQPHEKYILAIKRILLSSLSEKDQILLINEYTMVLDLLKKES